MRESKANAQNNQKITRARDAGSDLSPVSETATSPRRIPPVHLAASSTDRGSERYY